MTIDGMTMNTRMSDILDVVFGYYFQESSDNDNDDDDVDYDELSALLQKKKQQYVVSGIVQKPAHTERVLLSMSSLLPVQNTKLNNGGQKVEGILTIV